METRLRLVDGADELVLWELDSGRIDIILKKVEVGSPAAREVVEDRPNDNGTDDQTQYHGSAAVSVELEVFDTPQQLLDLIKPWMRFGRRPWLCLDDDEWDGERRIRVRADQWSSPIPWERLGVARELQLQWKAPEGAWESTDLVTVRVLAARDQVGGRSYPYQSPRDFGTASVTGQVQVVNGGDSPSHQVIRMYGPCAGPRWTCESTGETVAFYESLVIPAGDYVEVDTRAGTAFYLSDPDASRLGDLNFSISSWWRLPAGESSVRYHPLSAVDVGCEAQVEFRTVHLP